MIRDLSLLNDALSYPESPRWNDGSLWLADVHNFRVLRLAADGGIEGEWPVTGRPAGMGFDPAGHLLVATAIDRTILRLEDGDLRPVADLSGLATGMLNDMVVDGNGAVFVGDTGYDVLSGAEPQPGRIIGWGPNRPPRVLAEDMTFPNGVVITPDGRTLYVAETFASRISRFDIEDDGSLTNRIVHAELSGIVDGICLDASGAIWAAMLEEHAFVRIGPSGEEVDRISVSPDRAIACMLGGSDRRTLFMGAAQISKAPDGSVVRRGRVLTCPVEIAGAGYP